ncbi:hypothetical protein D3C86_1271960 [compost metagenome]
MIAGQHFTGPGQTSLDFIPDKQYVGSFTHFICLGQVALVRYKYASLSLYRFYQESGNIFILQGQIQCGQIIVVNYIIARHKRSEIIFCCRIGAERDYIQCTSVEIIFSGNDDRFILWYAFLYICPSSGQFQCRLYGFYPTVHRQYFVIAEQFGNIF